MESYLVENQIIRSHENAPFLEFLKYFYNFVEVFLMTIQVLHRDDLQQGGFAGLREYRLIMDPTVFGGYADSNSWQGIGNLVYFSRCKIFSKW